MRGEMEEMDRERVITKVQAVPFKTLSSHIGMVGNHKEKDFLL